MIIDALLLLSEAGFPVRDYHYLGMGSVHFVDFAMIHKFLGILKMTSVEASPKLIKRIEFNRPYRNAVETIVGKEIGDIISGIEENTNYLVWLDYDNVLSDYMIRDIILSMSKLASGSILLVTIDTEPPKSVGEDGEREMTPVETKAYFEAQAGPYLARFSKDEDYIYENLPNVTMEAVQGAIRFGLTGIRNKEFFPLFDFLYKDTNRMLTAGGMVGGRSEKRKIRRSRLRHTGYARFDLSAEPCRISVPPLTRKEVLYLESYMPANQDWRPSEFELSDEDVSQFRQIYRFFPTYAELFL
jgi:hypothetical protein